MLKRKPRIEIAMINRMIQTVLVIIVFMPSMVSGAVMHNVPDNEACNFESKIAEISVFLKRYPSNRTAKESLVIASIQHALQLNEAGQNDRAIEVLENAESYNASIFQLHMFLAKLYFDRGDLLDAKKHISIALLIKPEDPYLLRFNARIMYLLEEYTHALNSYTLLVENGAIMPDMDEFSILQKEMNRAETYLKLVRHPFVIHYSDETFASQAELIGNELISTYLKLCAWMKFTASHDIPVYLYTASQFKDFSRDSHSVGVYDGKIRILVGGRANDDIRVTAAHELTHHVLAYASRNAIPFWLNEGLAQYVSGECEPNKILKKFHDEPSILDLHTLETDVVHNYTHNKLQTAYIQSYIAVKYLIETYGEEIIVEILDGLSKGSAVEDVIKDVTLMDYTELSQEIKLFALTIQNENNRRLAMNSVKR